MWLAQKRAYFALMSQAQPFFYWQNWSSPDLQQRIAQAGAAGVAVLPLAAIEQHGPHLPLSVDTDIVNGIVARAAACLPAEAPIFILPTQSVGLSTEHGSFSGTLTLRPETALALWQDLAASVAASGIQKLLLFNSHGGNVGLMDVAAREIRARWQMAVWHSSWYNLPFVPVTKNLFSADEHRFGVHAGAVETSLMLALAPERVAMQRAENFASSSQARARDYAIIGNGSSAKLGWSMQDYNAQGAAGDASAASAEKGEALLQASGELLAQMLQEISQIPLNQVLGETKKL